MQIFKIQIAHDESGNSPWDAIWYDGDYEDLDVLDCQMRLGSIWKAPSVRMERRIMAPDIFMFELRFAISIKARDILAPLVDGIVEYLPLEVPGDNPIFALHPLIRIDLDNNAVFQCSSVSGNISVIQKYSFDIDQLTDDVHVFQVLNPRGSAARDGGFPCYGVLVSTEFKQICEANNLQGVVFEKI